MAGGLLPFDGRAEPICPPLKRAGSRREALRAGWEGGDPRRMGMRLSTFVMTEAICHNDKSRLLVLAGLMAVHGDLTSRGIIESESAKDVVALL